MDISEASTLLRLLGARKGAIGTVGDLLDLCRDGWQGRLGSRLKKSMEFNHIIIIIIIVIVIVIVIVILIIIIIIVIIIIILVELLDRMAWIYSILSAG